MSGVESGGSTHGWLGRLHLTVVAAVSFSALALLDIATLLARGAFLSGSTLLLLLGVGAFWALLGAGTAILVQYLWHFSSRVSPRVRVALLSAFLALVPLGLLYSLAATGLPSLVGVVRWVFVGGTAAATLVACGFAAAWLLRRGAFNVERPLPVIGGVILVAVALGAFVADATVLIRLYPEIHYGLSYLALLCLVVALIYTPRLSRPFQRVWAVRGLAVALLTFATVASLTKFPASDYSVLLESSTWSKKLVLLSRSIIDLDRDGYSLILGGGDCQDRNARINPAAIDIPENGVDDDCTDGDLTLEKILAVMSPASPSVVRGGARPSHVFLFTVDTLRADHLGAYGYERNTSPHLDELARSAVLFERAFSQSNNTASSFPSMLTGRYPSGSPWSFEPEVQHARGWPFLHDENNVTLPEVLGAAGFRTAAIMRGSVALETGLDQGIARKVLDPEDPVRAFSQVLDESGTAPLFAWLHLDYPHDPYSPPALPFGSSAVDAYDAEIFEADRVIGGALGEIRRRGLWDSSVVAVTADHGEEFGEHGGRFHASTLYNEQIHVPLIVHFPGQSPRRVTRNVQVVDLMPTIAESVGSPLAAVDGRSLFGEVAFEASAAYSEQYDGSVRRRALIQGPHKLIHRISTNTLELYDLVRDPKETKNLIDSEPELGQRLRTAMDAIASRRELLLVALASRGDRQGMERLAENVYQISRVALKEHAVEMVSSEIQRGGIPAATLSKVASQSMLPQALRDLAFDALVRLGPGAASELARLARGKDPLLAARAKTASRALRENERSRTETVRISSVEFDGSKGEASLQGFGGPEVFGSRTVRWGTEKRSRIAFGYSGSPRQLSLSLEARAIAAASAAMAVQVTCNGKPLGSLSIPKTWALRGLQIPAHAVLTGENVLELSYSETVEPAKIDAASKDARHLSVMYDWLVIATIADRADVDLRSAAAGVVRLSGFYDTEGTAGGAFRWSQGRRSEVELFLMPDEKRDYELILDARAFHPIAPVGVRVSINGSSVGRVEVSEKNQTRGLLIPGHRLSPVLRIELEYEKSAKPADVIPSSKDTRDLALRWSGFHLVPVRAARETTGESAISLPAAP